MRAVPSGLASHLALQETTLAICWTVTRKDATVIRGTQLDRNIVITTGARTGTYSALVAMTASDIRSTSDMAVDSVEVEGSPSDDVAISDLTIEDIEAGQFDGAPFVLFLVNYQAPDDGQLILRTGTIGPIRRTSEGRYTAELRGLSQALQQMIGRTLQPTCDAELGDARCKFDIDSVTVTGTVTSVTSRRRFDSTLSGAGAAGDYVHGKVTFTSGANDGYSMEVRRDAVSDLGDIELYEPVPFDVEIGDTFDLAPGCRKSMFDDCRDRFDNIVNFRGHGIYIPGINAILRGPNK